MLRNGWGALVKAEGMSKTALVVGSIASAMLLACMAAALMAVPGFGKARTVTLVGAGDIARCDDRSDRATARLLGKTRGTIFTLGDNAYPDGTRAQFRDCYAPTWGKYKKRTKPAVGNHEYHTPGAKGYFEYFRARAGKPGRGYYAYDRGRWHIVALNSNCEEVGCGARSRQAHWLRRNLRNHRARCTLAYFHHPLYASGRDYDSPEVRRFWTILFKRGADIVLSGHAHRYERYAPITPSGKRSDRGIRQFIVGTGGAPGGAQKGPNDPRMRAKKIGTPGVLKLRLRPESYRWKFVPVAGRTYSDSGKDRCH
jgi:acid phosphatase type 7